MVVHELLALRAIEVAVVDGASLVHSLTNEIDLVVEPKLFGNCSNEIIKMGPREDDQRGARVYHG